MVVHFNKHVRFCFARILLVEFLDFIEKMGPFFQIICLLFFLVSLFFCYFSNHQTSLSRLSVFIILLILLSTSLLGACGFISRLCCFQRITHQNLPFQEEFEDPDADVAPPSVDLNEDGGVKGRGDAVTLEDNALIVDISDAMSEREKVLFTVHTKVRRQIGFVIEEKAPEKENPFFFNPSETFVMNHTQLQLLNFIRSASLSLRLTDYAWSLADCLALTVYDCFPYHYGLQCTRPS